MFFRHGSLESSESVSEEPTDKSAETSFLVAALDSSQPTVNCVMKCGLCDFKTLAVDEMNSHIGREGHFAAGKLPICPHCPFVAASPQELLDHGKSHFAGFTLVSYFCSKCSFKSTDVEAIEKHQQIVHIWAELYIWTSNHFSLWTKNCFLLKSVYTLYLPNPIKISVHFR